LLAAVGIYQALKDAFEFEAEIGFRAYVRGRIATEWVIAADFVTSGPERANDTFAFTVYARERDNFSDLLSEIRSAIPADIKRVRHLDPKAATFLADRRRFHFCFIPNQERHQLGSWEETQAAVDELVKHIRTWPDSPAKAGIVRKFEALMQRAKASKFKYTLLHDITLLAALSAYVAILIAKHAHPEIIMFAFDRDAMTTAFDGMLYDMASLNFDTLCKIENVPRDRIILSNAIDMTAKNGQRAWTDDLIRVPDYIAGSLAQWDFWTDKCSPVRSKVAGVIEHVIAENPNLVMLVIRFGIFGITCSRARAYSRAHPNRAAYDYGYVALADYLAWTILRHTQSKQVSYKRGISDATAVAGIRQFI